MKLMKQGTTFALVFLITWLLIEGVFIGLTVPKAPLIASPLNLGVAAPIVLLTALLGGITLLAWSRFLNTTIPVSYVIRRVRRWLTDTDSPKRQRHIAYLIGIPLIITLWFTLGFFIQDAILIQVKTPLFAKTLLAIIQTITAIVFSLLSPILFLTLERIFHNPIFTLPRVLTTIAVTTLLAIIIVVIAGPQSVILLPWHFVLAPILALATTLVLAFFTLQKPHATRWVLPASITLCIALGLLAAYMPVSWNSSRHLFVGQPTIASFWYGWLEKRLDYDNDGAIHLYAGNDCAPHDPMRGPHATEIVNNGIDENCSDFDLQIDLQDYNSGKTSHPRPHDIAKRPNIILITTDALTFSYTTLGGNKRDTTPNLKDWAKRATVFEHGFSLSSSTRLALPGLLAGQYNSTVEMTNRRSHPYSYGPDTQTLASILKQNGYQTVFVPGHNIFSIEKWPGISTGFDTTDQLGFKKSPSKDHTATTVTERALHHIRTRDPKKPLFLWVHYFDHHSPYITPPGHKIFDGNTKLDHYENELHWTDKHWAILINEVEKTWKPHDFITVFTADHGEPFTQKGDALYHGVGLSTELLHVPIIIQAPKARGKRIPGLTSHADIPTTLINLLGISPPESWIGESLIPVLFDDQPIEKNILYATFYLPEDSKRSQDPFRNIALRTPNLFYQHDLRKGTHTLTNWLQDPRDQQNLAKSDPKTLETYRYLANQHLQKLRQNEKSLSHLRK